MSGPAGPAGRGARAAASAGRVLAIARRELLATFHAPIAYVVLVLFLALEGFSFWAVVEVLADPSRPAGYGAVLRTHFGGTFLYWAVLFAVVALTTMRLVAEERRHGTWEALLTTAVSEAEVVLGKWLGAAAFYALLWLPTAAYPVVLAAYAPPGTEVDLGPIASAYLGVALSGAGFLALGLCASAATESQVVAAVTSFAALLGLLLVGQLEDVSRDLGRLSAIVRQLDLRGHMDGMARGAIELDAVALFAGLAALGLAGAVVLAARGRGSRAAARRRLACLGLVALSVALVNVLAARHPVGWDVSAGRVNRLDDRTVAVLAEVRQPVTVTVVRPEVEAFEPIYAEVDRVLARMERAQPRLSRRDLDPARQPDEVAALAGDLALSPRDLADGGAVLFSSGRRRRGVDLLDLAELGRDVHRVGAMTGFRAEEAFARALVELTAADRPVVCATSGHGEMPLAAEQGRAHWGQVGQRLDRGGFAIEDAGDVRGGVPARCRVLVVAGPAAPLAPDSAIAVARFLGAGGRLLVAAPDQPPEGDGAPVVAATGLELVLAEYGVALPAAVVVDPQGALDVPLAWATATGYGAHPITAAFQGRRLTVWQHPRAVLYSDPAPGSPARRGTMLVRGSPTAWGETDLASLFGGRDVEAGTDDLVGAAAVAVAVESDASHARLVVLGSATSPSSELVGRGLGAADALVASAIAWLSGRTVSLDIGAKTPEHLRLVMTPAARRGVFALCVVVLPLLAAALGGLLWWRRRRG
ncbi:MAG TPA: Gldg family protein [Kofleriaceae bacterium]|nr:Gldg family protein [Kofleriaceae bacterium]